MSGLVADRRGATLVEFALILPVLLALFMGLCDLTYQIYAQSVLNGEVQKAARDSGIEGGAASATTIDARVVKGLGSIMAGLTNNCSTGTFAVPVWCSTRKSFDTFGEITPEPFVDANNNKSYDAGECFTDVNGNGSWDAEPGAVGQGGASAITIYTMTVTYPRIFPLAALIGWSRRQTISARTIFKNQPYATQTMTDSGTETICG